MELDDETKKYIQDNYIPKKVIIDKINKLENIERHKFKNWIDDIKDPQVRALIDEKMKKLQIEINILNEIIQESMPNEFLQGNMEEEIPFLGAIERTEQRLKGNFYDICKYCDSQKLFVEIQGTRRGLYCSKCGKWQKWLTKQELQVAKIKGYKIIERRVKNANITN